MFVFGGGFLEEADEFLVGYGYPGPAAGKQALELLYVYRMAAQVQRYRHGERDEPDILAGEEQDDEILMGIGDERDVVAALQVQAEKSLGGQPRLLLEVAVRHDGAEPAFCVVEVAAGDAGGSIIQRFR